MDRISAAQLDKVDRIVARLRTEGRLVVRHSMLFNLLKLATAGLLGFIAVLSLLVYGRNGALVAAASGVLAVGIGFLAIRNFVRPTALVVDEHGLTAGGQLVPWSAVEGFSADMVQRRSNVILAIYLRPENLPPSLRTKTRDGQPAVIVPGVLNMDNRVLREILGFALDDQRRDAVWGSAG